MIFQSKYEIGQNLWEIRMDLKTELERCPTCGRTIFTNKGWKVYESEQEIHGINMQDGKIYYKVWRPCVYTEMLPESDIGRIYFPTREEAIMECQRLNTLLDIQS